MKSLLQSIGDYDIVEKLGRGGMADVYLAVDRKTGRRVALKLVEQGLGAEAQEIVEAERLGSELQNQISLVDPRVPQIHAAGDLDGYFFIEMEFVEGNDLSTLIASGGLKPSDAAAIARELSGILHHVHGMSLQIGGRELRAIVHGDIKPRNIRIDTAGRVRVLDFGIAKGLSITRRLTSNVFGSVAYSSPERLETGNIDEMSDLWSVAVVLYEMVEGRLPFEAPSTERLETVIRSRGAIRPLKQECPPALQQIIYKALAYSPGSRYQNAAQLESDLIAFLEGRDTLAAQENEQTRRTVHVEPEKPGEEDIETRRTVALEEPPPESALLQVTPPPAPVQETPFSQLMAKIKTRLLHHKKWVLAASFIFFAIIAVWEGIAIDKAAELKPQFSAGRLDADSGWSRFQNVKKSSLLGIAPLMIRTEMKDLLMESSERVFTEYRNSDSPKVREGDWNRCRKYLLRALQLGLNDRKSESMLEYATGQTLRINRKNFDAIAAFQRAASLQPRWADPYLGLARTYITNLDDMDRGTQALERARELGYRFGKRELAMMADAHKKRALQDWENAKSMQGTDQEKEFLGKAKKEFEQSLDLYLQVAPWGESTAQILIVQDSLAQIKQKLDELSQPNPILPWNWFK